jgi:hypothetical protein
MGIKKYFKDRARQAGKTAFRQQKPVSGQLSGIICNF